MYTFTSKLAGITLLAFGFALALPMQAQAQEGTENRWRTGNIREMHENEWQRGKLFYGQTKTGWMNQYDNWSNIRVAFQLTLDDKLVLMTRMNWGRQTTRLVRDMNFSEIRALDAGYLVTRDHGQTYPYRGKGLRYWLLEDVLDIAKPLDCPLRIEFSGADENQLAAVLQAFNLIERKGVGHLIKFVTQNPNIFHEIKEDAKSPNVLAILAEHLDIDILTYNVAGMWQGVGIEHRELFMPLISARMNHYDLVLVQEDFSYHDRLDMYSDHKYKSVPKRVTSPAAQVLLGPLGSPMIWNDGLNRFSNFRFTSFSRVKWNDSFGIVTNDSDHLAPKGYTFARHEIKPGVFVDVYNLHMDAGENDVRDARARRSQVEQLLEDIGKASKGFAVIIAGDTNLIEHDQYDEPVLERLVDGGGLTDSARKLGITNSSFDRVLYRSSSNVQLEAISWEFAPEFVFIGHPSSGIANGTPLSDHKPVHVKMRVTSLTRK